MLRKPSFPLSLALLCGLCLAVFTPAQTPDKPPPTGVIAGRLTIKSEPAPRVTVLLVDGEQFGTRKTLAQTVTDEDGRYRLTGLAARSYSVQPLAPAYVASGESDFYGARKTIKLADGETVNDVDFTLVRGGVITGRVTDAEGKPMITERVQAKLTDEKANNNSLAQIRFTTDDRGVYRIYGLRAGNYVVSAGRPATEMSISPGQFYYPQTFHSNASERKDAKVIEVSEGGETTGADIILSKPLQTFRATGRIVDAETGEPVAGVTLGYGRIEQGRLNGYGSDNRPTDAQGQFALEGLTAGEHGVFFYTFRETSANYSDVTRFSITDGDLSGLEIKLRRGSALNGVVALEGAEDPALLARLRTLRLFANQSDNNQLMPGGGRQLTIGADGSFSVTGLRPGRVRMDVLRQNAAVNDFVLLRMEQNGVVAPREGLEVKAGNDLNNVRLVFEYGAGRLTGQLTYINGKPKDNERIFIYIRRKGETDTQWHSIWVDARGRFIVPGLSMGEYHISVNIFGPAGSRNLATQDVFVNGNGEASVAIIIDFAKSSETGGPR